MDYYETYLYIFIPSERFTTNSDGINIQNQNTLGVKHVFRN